MIKLNRTIEHCALIMNIQQISRLYLLRLDLLITVEQLKQVETYDELNIQLQSYFAAISPRPNDIQTTVRNRCYRRVVFSSFQNPTKTHLGAEMTWNFRMLRGALRKLPGRERFSKCSLDRLLQERSNRISIRALQGIPAHRRIAIMKCLIIAGDREKQRILCASADAIAPRCTRPCMQC